MAAVFHLVYISTATRPLGSSELFDLLRQSREKNPRIGITGILLYKEAAFMQALEGEEETVIELFETIRQDWRHHRINTLLTLTVPERQFPDWSMAFKNLDEGGVEMASVPGYRPLKELPPWVDILQWRASVAMRLLASFNDDADGLPAQP